MQNQRTSKILILFIAFFISFNSKIFAQTIVKFKPDSTIGKDAQIFTSYGCKISYLPSVGEIMNFGSLDEMAILDWTYSAGGCSRGTNRSLLKFTQLSSIPISATITNAKLNLYCVRSSGNWGTSYFSGSPYSLSNIGWVERVTGTWSEHLVTWNTQPTSTITNRAVIPASAARWGWATSIDVTDLVIDMKSSGSNEGFLLKLQTEAYYRSTLFATSDNIDSTLWPELVVTILDPCSGTVADFKDTNTSCYTFQFTDLSIAKDSGIVSWKWDFGDLSSSTLKNPSHTYANYGTYVVRLIVSDSSGCIDTISKSIVINYTHFANAGRDTTLCLIDGSATTFLRGNGGVSYNWTPSASLSHPNSKNTYATIKNNSVFYVDVIDSFGCQDRDTVLVNIFDKINLTIHPKDTIVCKNTRIQLNVSGAFLYQWSPASLFDFPEQNNPSVIVNDAQTLYVRGTDKNNCSITDTVHLRLSPDVKLSIIPKNAIGCATDSIQLNTVGALTYKWHPKEGLNNDSIANPIHYIKGVSKYIVTGINADGCEGYDSVIINQYPSPIVDAYSFANGNIVKCTGQEITLNATGASSYSWSPSEYCTNPNSSTTIVLPVNNTIFTVTGTNDNGCHSSDTISVLFEGKEKVYVPNSFTPNNDGINDRIGVLDQCNIQFVSFDIYNRWGQQVFSSNNINDRWNGEINGKSCETGTYFYLIKAKTLNGAPINFKGDISLLR